jgi:GxxExxY protein
MCVALTNRGITFETEKTVRVEFEHSVIGTHRLDLVVDGIVVELKAVKEVADVHKNQLLSYLRASGFRVGILFNFNSSPLFIKRIVN